MALTKLTSLSGEAEIMGAVRGVNFEGETLEIRSVSLEDAVAILDRLATGTLVAVAPKVGHLVKGGAARPAFKEEAPPAPSRPAEPAPEVPQGFTPVQPPEPTTEQAQERPQAGTSEAAEPPPAQQTADAGELPEELTKATSVRTVLTYLVDKGFNTADKLVAECQRVKEGVPVLSKVANLDERVRRAAAVLGVGE